MEGGQGSEYSWGGGQGSEYWGGGGELFAGCKLIRAPAPIHCQIITFLILKIVNIAKLRIELKSILLKIPSNKIKSVYILNWYICDIVFTISHRH